MQQMMQMWQASGMGGQQGGMMGGMPGMMGGVRRRPRGDDARTLSTPADPALLHPPPLPPAPTLHALPQPPPKSAAKLTRSTDFPTPARHAAGSRCPG